MRGLPASLGVFLGTLGAAAVGHTLVSAVRRRDVAGLKALGLSRRQVRILVASQTITLALVGMLLGVFAGRLAWRWVTTSMPLVYHAPIALLAVIGVVPAAVIAVNAVALVPARVAARMSPAEIFWAE